MNFRKFVTASGKEVYLGKTAENNDELVSKYSGKSNIIMHTSLPGSPFCVINKLRPTKKDIKEAATACAARSQDWRDNKKDVKVNIFSGKDVDKQKGMKAGTWRVKKKSKSITIKKQDIKEFLCQKNNQ